MILSSDTDYLTSKDEEERGKRGRRKKIGEKE